MPECGTCKGGGTVPLLAEDSKPIVYRHPFTKEPHKKCPDCDGWGRVDEKPKTHEEIDDIEDGFDAGPWNNT